MVRWKGLIGFVVIVALLALIGLWALPYGIKTSLEYFGSRATGATVSVGGVDVRYQPFGIEIDDLQAADPKNLDQNLFAFKQATVSVGLLKLLMNQVVVHDLSIQHFSFNSQRQSPGQLIGDKKSKGDKDAVSDEKSPKEPGFVDKGVDAVSKALPTAADILDREPLLIDEAQKRLAATAEEQQQKWPALIKGLPNENDLSDYETRLKAIIEGDIKSVDDFQQRVKALKALKKEIDTERRLLVKAKDEFKQDQATLRSQLSDLKNAPQADFKRLKSKYTFDQQGAGQYAALLFGPEIGGYMETALSWYDTAEPILQNLQKESAGDVPPARGEGRIIRFPEQSPTPDFIVEKSVFTIDLDVGTMNGKATDITFEQKLINRPTRIEVASTALEGIGLVDIKAVLDYRADKAVNTANFVIGGYQVSGQSLVSSDELSVSLAKAEMQANGELQLIERQVSGGWKSLFSQAQFESSSNNEFVGEIGKAFENIHDFSLDVGVTGSLTNPKLDISSNFDRRLGNAFNQRFKARQAQLERDLKNKLQAELGDYLQEAGVVEADMVKQQAFLDDMDAQLKKMLDAEVTQQTDKHQKKLEKELQKQLDKLF
ncbi:Uncharacterised protein [BD1-7 clade bacterium]|uniref:TIGR03545 family protein n=1 Tax=BD1-7 clade bacterium TaxID=2029982 RepID=A0A5S9QDN5_9GAMM|nr:Uncharacterised protein [BD1-7 clade bacterium]